MACYNLEKSVGKIAKESGKFFYFNWEKLEDYHVEYSYCGKDKSTTSEKYIKEIFERKFDRECIFKRAIPMNDYIKEVVKDVIEGIKKDLKKK